MSGDRPILARVNCYEALDVMLSVSLHFQRAHLWPLEKLQNSPAALLLHTDCTSAVPVKFIITMIVSQRVAGRLPVPPMRSRDILFHVKGDHLD